MESREFLKKYGIESGIIDGLEEKKKESLRLNISILFVGFVLFLILSILNLKKEENELKKITEYIKQINNKSYELKIEENSEYELSFLRNELYKITVMLKEEAESSSKGKEMLQKSLEDISHQLKTPLTSISIMLDNIKENPDMDIETREMFLSEITRQISHVNWLVISMLKLARLDSNTVNFEKEEINVYELLHNIIKNLEIPLEIKEQKIYLNGKQNAKFIGDYNWEIEAITNIIKNCIEHSENKKSIHIDFEENNLYTKIQISDEGKGIEKEELKHIFERFYKGKDSDADSIGIGLALSKSIIEKDGGKIRCSSILGKGTSFEIKYMK